MKQVNVGIRSMGRYIPETVHDSAWIGAASNIPEAVIREKFGIKQVQKASPEESVTFMAVEAAKRALGDIDASEIDMVVYCGSEYKDHYLYNCAAHIQHLLGATKAAAFEVHTLCSAGVWSLKILKSMMIQDTDLRKVLLISSSKEGDLINYADSESRFMFNFGDGAVAVLLERDYNRNVILESAMIAEGQFATDIYLPSVGSISRANHLDAKPEDHYLRVLNRGNMKDRLDPITLTRFEQVMERATAKSGFQMNDVNFIAPIFMKRSILNHLLGHFNLTEENSFVLEEFGHCQSADAFLSLMEGEKCGRLKDGDLAIMVAAGTGYTWAATAVRWGEVTTEEE